MFEKLSPEYQKMHKYAVCENLRYALERFQQELELNRDEKAIRLWEKKINELIEVLNILDTEITV